MMMSNELNIPVGGVGPEGAFDVMCLGQKFTIHYVINMRSGATYGMVKDTIKHFKHAINCLANGAKRANSSVGERDEYHDVIEHGESRSNIWTFRSFAVVPIGDKIFKVPVNLCNEFTSADTLINWVWFAVELMNDNDLVDDFIKSGHIIESKPQAKQHSALDEYFPRDENNQPVQPERTDVAPPSGKPGQATVIDYDYKLHDEYTQEFMGQLVEVQVEKIAWELRAKKDHSGSYEKIFAYLKEHYENPIWNLSIFSDGKSLQRAFPGMLEKAGDVVTGDFGLIFKINTGKNGKVYWNLHDVDIRRLDGLFGDEQEPQAISEPDIESPGDLPPGDYYNQGSKYP
jgi:hypothetical protein